MRKARLTEAELTGMTRELDSLVIDESCRKMALALGPEPPEFLYSVFLARLVHLRRLLGEHGGELVITHAGPEVRSIFNCCCLDMLFPFLPDCDAAVRHWAETPAQA